MGKSENRGTEKRQKSGRNEAISRGSKRLYEAGKDMRM